MERAVVLVEGESDAAALRALARRRGVDLARESVAVEAIGGSKNIRRALERFGPRGLDVQLAGLYDEPEEVDIRRGIQATGIGRPQTRADLEAFGFYACVPDLEAELIRALGVETVQRLIEEQGELGSFRTLQKQVAQQGRTVEEQLHRFMGSKGGRKIRYGPLLVDALAVTDVPAPLDRVLAFVTRP
jgi:hypothetical protein